jgi:hypothetical protein
MRLEEIPSTSSGIGKQEMGEIGFWNLYLTCVTNPKNFTLLT